MAEYHFRPNLAKRRILRHADCTVYGVNGMTVRNVARPDEEFGNFATADDFPDLIPKGEIWISCKIASREGVFFIANALAQAASRARGRTADHAYDEGLQVERFLREKLNGVAFRDGKPHKTVPDDIYLERYFSLPDPQGPVEVWLVDGNLVRSYYKTDYTEGGHGYVYAWVPRPEIWAEDGVDHRELPYIVAHEYLERRLMRDASMDYDPAHEVCSRLEFDLRKRKEIKLYLAPGRRSIRKSDLSRLCSEELFEYVQRRYVRR